jgi:hypothetical protein
MSEYDRGQMPEVGYQKADLRLRIDYGLISPQIHVDQTEFGGVAHQFDGAVQVQLIHNVGTVIIDGLGAYEKLFRNLFG